MSLIPHEFAVSGVFMSPLLVAGLLGTVATLITGRVLNRYQVSKYFFYPPLVFLALMTIYTVLIETLMSLG
jgi:hypothetical protein